MGTLSPSAPPSESKNYGGGIFPPPHLHILIHVYFHTNSVRNIHLVFHEKCRDGLEIEVFVYVYDVTGVEVCPVGKVVVWVNFI